MSSHSPLRWGKIIRWRRGDKRHRAVYAYWKVMCRKTCHSPTASLKLLESLICIPSASRLSLHSNRKPRAIGICFLLQLQREFETYYRTVGQRTPVHLLNSLLHCWWYVAVMEFNANPHFVRCSDDDVVNATRSMDDNACKLLNIWSIIESND